jgi:hypothetical protein
MFRIFNPLIGLRLSIVRRAADMLVLHFGVIRPHHSGTGTVGDHALHVQCPWRLQGPLGTITGRDDLWVYAGPGERPDNWSYEDGFSLQDQKLDKYFARDEATRSWVNEKDGFVVMSTEETGHGDVRLELQNGMALVLFPAGSVSEAWRFFTPGEGGDHVVFAAMHVISRRAAPQGTSR